MKLIVDEVLNQEEISIDMPSRNHASILSNLGGIFFQHKNKFRSFSQLSLKLNGWASIPDFCVYPQSKINWNNDELEVTTSPLLVVEIVSPQQGTKELIDKFENYFANGVKSCWLLNPLLHQVIIYDAQGNRTYIHNGLIQDTVLEIDIKIDDVFE
jgi:Uma2 family endonuclease